MEPRLSERSPSTPSELLHGLARTEKRKGYLTPNNVTHKVWQEPGLEAGRECAGCILSLVMTLQCHQQKLVCLFLRPGVHISPRSLMPSTLDKASSLVTISAWMPFWRLKSMTDS